MVEVKAPKATSRFPKISMSSITSTIESLLRTNSIVSKTFVSDKLIVRAKRKTYLGKIINHGNIEVYLTIGKPNYDEAKKISKLKKIKTKFPFVEIKYPKS